MGVVGENFWLKALKRVYHHWQKLSITASVFVETFRHTYSLSEEGFGYTTIDGLKVQRVTRVAK